jgi:hypothetical protein
MFLHWKPYAWHHPQQDVFAEIPAVLAGWHPDTLAVVECLPAAPMNILWTVLVLLEFDALVW